MKKIDFLRGVVCEDIRFETSGNFSLMGVFNGLVLFEGPEDAPPPKLRLAFYIEVLVREATSVAFDFRRLGSSKSILEYKGEVNKNEEYDGIDAAILKSPLANTASFSFATREVSFDASGVYQLRGREADGRWQEIVSFEVVVKRT